MTASVVAIVGPTAVGKTEVSIEVARAIGAEIVSIDSMQVYRGMDVGTAKPSAEQCAAVPHHMIDVAAASHALTVAEFQSMARSAIEDIHGRGRVPLLVGGSGLYFRAVVDDLEFPPRSEETRARLEEEAGELGAEVLHARLAALDPRAAARIEPANARRIVRALEVIEVTGRPFSDNDGWERYESVYDLHAVALGRERDELAARIEARVDRMLADGLVAEARALQAKGMSVTARQALGYRQILDASPDATEEELRPAIVTATRRFARRQESWFRADPRLLRHDASEPGAAEALASYFSRALRLP